MFDIYTKLNYSLGYLSKYNLLGYFELFVSKMHSKIIHPMVACIHCPLHARYNIMSTRNIIIINVDMQHNKKSFYHAIQIKVHVNITFLHVDINKSHVNIIMLHVDLNYLACSGQKYATIMSKIYINLFILFSFTDKEVSCLCKYILYLIHLLESTDNLKIHVACMLQCTLYLRFVSFS